MQEQGRGRERKKEKSVRKMRQKKATTKRVTIYQGDSTMAHDH